jgi:hypothetical protein
MSSHSSERVGLGLHFSTFIRRQLWKRQVELRLLLPPALTARSSALPRIWDRMASGAVVEVYDPDWARLKGSGQAHRLLGGVRQPLQALDPSAVAKVEAGHGIAGASALSLACRK